MILESAGLALGAKLMQMARSRLLPLVRNHYDWADEFQVQVAPVVVRKWGWKGEFIRHDHDFWEIQFCTSGEAIHCSLEGEQPMRPGDVFILRPGASHAFKNCRNLGAYVCCFASSILRHELAWTLTEPKLNQLLWWQDPNNLNGITTLCLRDEPVWTHCQIHLDALEELSEEDNPNDRARRTGHLTLLLAELAERLPRAVTASPEKDLDPTAMGYMHPSLQAALRILHEGLAEEWTAAALARKLRIDESYLGRLFRASIGVSPMAYLAKCRAERAACLLLQSKLNIAEIGARVGWPDPNHFARRFRQHYGLSASAYRCLDSNKV